MHLANKSKLKSRIYIVLGIILLLGACRNAPHSPEQEKKSEKEEKLEEALIEANKRAVSEEQHMIRKYISRHQWNMTKTGSGIYYGIYSQGDGPKALEGRRVTIHYTIELINGYQAYNSKDKQPKTFVVGQGDAVTGLHKVMPLLSGGDKAKVIIPSNLAHGISGDQDQIPPKSTLIYDIHVLKVVEQ